MHFLVLLENCAISKHFAINLLRIDRDNCKEIMLFQLLSTTADLKPFLTTIKFNTLLFINSRSIMKHGREQDKYNSCSHRIYILGSDNAVTKQY